MGGPLEEAGVKVDGGEMQETELQGSAHQEPAEKVPEKEQEQQQHEEEEKECEANSKRRSGRLGGSKVAD